MQHGAVCTACSDITAAPKNLKQDTSIQSDSFNININFHPTQTNTKEVDVNKIKNQISNPMTVIATFAFISETSAAVSLPFLENEERKIYIWFLISFPFYLIFLFFLTLNFNYRSLYAPSDFAKDDNFLKAFDDTEPSNKSQETADDAAPRSKISDVHCAVNIASPHPGQVPDPPECDLSEVFPWVEYAVQLPKAIGTLRVIDVRQMSTQSQFDKLLFDLPRLAKQPCKFMVFLTHSPSDDLLKQTALRHIKQTKKSMGATRHIAYNVSRQTTTILRWD